ncbi:MAG TPA: hypothetical protein DHU96_32515 [Actinobacteria bacterium]|nr:hypothetical protein [Actinomycetota bacterium]
MTCGANWCSRGRSGQRGASDSGVLRGSIVDAGSGPRGRNRTGSSPDLTDFQLDVARIFFALPASKGFLRPLVKEQMVGRELERRSTRIRAH